MLPAGTYQISVTEYQVNNAPGGSGIYYGPADLPCPMMGSFYVGTPVVGILEYTEIGNAGSFLSIPWTQFQMLEPSGPGAPQIGSASGGVYRVVLPPVPAAGPQNWSGPLTVALVSLDSWTGDNTPNYSLNITKGSISLSVHVINSHSFIAYTAENAGNSPCYSVITGTLL